MRLLRLLLACLTLGCLAPAPSIAQADYPNRPVRLVVPFAPGANTDLLARLFAKGFADALGGQFIVDNKPGGGTNIAAELVARSAPDGCTLFVAQFASHAANKWLYSKLSYDPIEDFAAVGVMAETPFFLLVNARSPIHTVQELVGFARQKAGGVSYGSSAVGSPIHIAGELLRMQANIQAVHVAYRGAAPAAADLVAGNIDFMFDATAMSLVKSGQLRAIAVADSKRWPTQPDIPSMAEQGFPDFDVKGFFALVAPAKTPAAILERLNGVMVDFVRQPDVASRMQDMQLKPMSMTRAESHAYLVRQSTRWEKVVKASGAKVE